MENTRKDIIKRILIIGILMSTIIVTFIILGERPTHADSGFDFSYDSGGGSDWSSSDWGDSDYDYDYDYDHGSGSGGIRITSFSDLLVILITVAILIILKNSKGKATPTQVHSSEIDDSRIEEKIKQYIPDFNKKEFLDNGYKIYVDVQNAWMNFELEKVKDKITPELYSSYESQLATLEVKGEQNIMNGFIKSKAFLKDVLSENNTITITTGYIIEFYDYIIDVASGKVLRGTKRNKARVTYEMKFRKTLDKNEKITKCPNCGAEVDINTTGICPYCRSKLVVENTQWVLTQKRTLGQVLI